jgi:hypothetical protein
MYYTPGEPRRKGVKKNEAARATARAVVSSDMGYLRSFRQSTKSCVSTGLSKK